MEKKVYLDLNKYIELGRIWHKIASDNFGILDYISEMKNKKELIFPICSSHIIELAKNSKIETRERLAEVMWVYSDGLILINQSEILDFEIDNSIKLFFYLNNEIHPMDILCKNLLRGFLPLQAFEDEMSFPKEVINFLSFKFQQKNDWVNFVASSCDEDRMNTMNILHTYTKEIAGSINKNRALINQESTKIKNNAHLAMLILDTQDKVISRLNKFGLEMKDLLGLGLENITAFYQSIPTYDIEYRLRLQASKNKEKATVENDIFDIVFLSNAICYFDVVITEKYWANIAKQTKMHKKYNTLIETSLLALMPADPLT